MRKTPLIASTLALALGITAVAADAQSRGKDGPERASFAELDADGNGEVTIAEMQAFGAARFAAADTDGDGSLSAEEMIAAREGRNAERLERRIERMIERADNNGNGTLELNEIGPDQDRMTRRFERVDADGSGGISEAEMEAAKDARGDRGGRKGGGRDRG